MPSNATSTSILLVVHSLDWWNWRRCGHCSSFSDSHPSAGKTKTDERMSMDWFQGKLDNSTTMFAIFTPQIPNVQRFLKELFLELAWGTTTTTTRTITKTRTRTRTTTTTATTTTTTTRGITGLNAILLSRLQLLKWPEFCFAGRVWKWTAPNLSHFRKEIKTAWLPKKRKTKRTHVYTHNTYIYIYTISYTYTSIHIHVIKCIYTYLYIHTYIYM